MRYSFAPYIFAQIVSNSPSQRQHTFDPSVRGHLAFGHLDVHGAEVWDNPEGGNFIISVSETKINWGSINPVNAINKLKGEDARRRSVMTWKIAPRLTFPMESEIGSLKIEIKDSTFNYNSPGTMDDMLEVLYKIVSNGNCVKSQAVTYKNPPRPCPPFSLFCECG